MLDDITFYTLQEPLTISDGFQNHIISYSISYSDSVTGNICSQTTTIPAIMCYNRICTDVFEVSSSFCHPSTNITISVFATSMLGPGQSSDPLTICNYAKYYSQTQPLSFTVYSSFFEQILKTTSSIWILTLLLTG